MNPDDDAGPSWPQKGQEYDMNGKIMLGAVISLSAVIIVVVILHIYARFKMTRRQGGATVHHIPFHHQRHVDPTGLEPSLIASLPLFIVKDQELGSDCAVCLSDLEQGEEARLLPNCKHRFHVECIDTWLGNQSSCPICRADVAPWDDDDVYSAPSESVHGSTKDLAGSSSRLSSFRRIISGDWSSRRVLQDHVVQSSETNISHE